MESRGSNEDFAFRMCKKVAQLTKVIYQLNCRNEDHDAETRHLKRQHEAELTAVLADAEAKVRLVEEVMDAMKAQHERDQKKTVQHAEMLRSAAVETAETARKAFEERTRRMTQELSLAKIAFEDTVRQLKANFAEERLALSAKKDEEAEKLVCEYNAKYSAMLAEQLQAQDDLEQRLNAEWQAKAKEQEAQLLLKAQGADRALALERDIQDLQQRLEEQQATVRSLQEKARASAQRERQLQAQLKDLTDGNSGYLVTIRELEAKMAALGKEASEAERALQAASAAEKESAALLQRARSKMTTLENDLSVLSAANQSLTGDLDAQRKQVQELSKALAQARSEAEMHARSVKSNDAQLRAEISRLSQIMVEKESEWEQIKGAHAAALQEQSKRHDEELRRLLSSTSSASSERIAQLQAEHLQRESRWKLESEAIREAHAAQIRDVEEQHRAEMAALQRARNEAEHALRTALEATIAGLWTELDAQRLSSEEAYASLEQQLANLRGDLLAQEAASGTAMQGAEASLREKDVEITRLRSEIDRIREEAAKGAVSLQGVAEKRVGDLIARQEEELQLLKSKHADELSHLQQEHESTLRQQREALDQVARETLEAELRRMESEWLSKLARERQVGDDQVQQRERALREEMDRLAEAERQRRQQLSEEKDTMAAERHRVARELEECTRSWKHELEEARRTHAAAMDDLRRELGCVHESTLASLRDDHEQQVAQLVSQLEESRADGERKVKNVEESLRSEWRAQQQQHQEAMEALRSSSEADQRRALGDLQHQWDADAARRDAKLAGVEAELVKSMELAASELEVVKSSLRRSEQDLREMTRHRDEQAYANHEQRLAHEEEVRVLRDRFHSELDSSARLHREEREAEAGRHAAEIANALSLLAQEKRDRELEGKDLRQRLADLQHKYEYRESRTEDVAKINELMREVREKTALVAQTREEMRTYKLELLNREENYNKMFGRKPVVAAPTTGVHASSGSVPGGRADSRKPSSTGSYTASAESLPVIRVAKTSATSRGSMLW